MEKTIKNLDAISKYSIYSKLNVNFDRILGDRSLKGFVRINKKPKILKKINILEEIYKKFPKEFKDKKELELFEDNKQITIKETENNINENKNNNKYYKIFKSEPNEKTSIKDYFSSKKKNKYEEIISLYPFKYYPNYDSIYKKIPYVHIIEPKGDRKNNSFDKKVQRKNQNKSSSSSITVSINNIKEGEHNNSKDNKKSISNNSSNLQSTKLPIVNMNRNSVRNENHALRFSKYGNQRIYKSRNDENVFQMYYNNSISGDKINMKKINTVDFDKMMSRKEKDFVNYHSLKIPSFNRYSPNYDFVKDTPTKISFSYHSIDNDINKKKYIIRKLIASYNVDTELHIFNLDKTKHNNTVNSIDK